MATANSRAKCSICNKANATCFCSGCSEGFCFQHLAEHQQILRRQLDEIINDHNQFQQKVIQQKQNPQNSSLIQQINEWETDSIEKIQQTAQQCRETLMKLTQKTINDVEKKFIELSEKLKEIHEENEFNEIDLKHFQSKLTQITKEFLQSSNISIRQDSQEFINKISIISSFEQIQTKKNRFQQFAITVAGGNGEGDDLNQLYSPEGIFIDNDKSIYIADPWNHRIVKWKLKSSTGQIIAGGNGQGGQNNPLKEPTDIIFDKFIAMKTVIKNLFICYNQQQMITRLQIFFLTVSLYCIFLYSTYTTQLITVEINKPTYSTYESLSFNYSQSLQCFCSDISIPYQSFLTIKPRFHDLCSSQFVSQDWINYLYGRGNLVYRYSFTDFRASAVGQLQLLTSLCEISQETINTSLVQLLTSDYNDRQLLSEQRLDQLIQTQINQFQLVTPNSLLNIFNLIRETLGANMIISLWSVNWLIATQSIINSGWTAHTIPIVYGKCNCGTSWTCTQSSQGMMVGCYPLESLLQTTLQCFYNQSCIDSTNKFTQLNISSLKTSQYRMSTTIQSILNNLMVEEYIINKSYENYFNQCAPSSCSYNYMKRYQVTEGIINIISLYSGLVILTRCLSVILIKLCSYKSNRITIEITDQNT
ncbi:unnamed protein product [Adineta steineri]|uniref:Transmembrane protein n=1 Tax=Adineta steineri TaxID=433720 RepID=A0A813S595_9BILA|nr:unnamed protein product [Adineta steineri]CAF4123269.1 unnamed protein product [Adineta steineri]